MTPFPERAIERPLRYEKRWRCRFLLIGVTHGFDALMTLTMFGYLVCPIWALTV